jgi:hypothetical protein
MRPGATLKMFFSVLLVFAGGSVRAQDAPPSEYQVKAAFIFNFAKFIEWPPKSFARPDTPLTIGVLGDNPFGANLEETLKGKTLNNRALVAKHCQNIDEAKTCHVLFVSASESKRVPEILGELGKSSILTISDTERFTREGGMINFFREGNVFRFEINDQAARNAGLKIASKLLELSRKPPR